MTTYFGFLTPFSTLRTFMTLKRTWVKYTQLRLKGHKNNTKKGLLPQTTMGLLPQSALNIEPNVFKILKFM